MWCEERLRATEEALMMHVDTSVGRASSFPDDLRARAEALLVPPPEHASRRIAGYSQPRITLFSDCMLATD